MLWLVIGGIACGKSAFADELALAVGREGIRLSCPSFPGGEAAIPALSDSPGFYRTRSEADETLPGKIEAINMESNFFRAERRVVVVDSLSGWLRASFARATGQGTGHASDKLAGTRPGVTPDAAGLEAARWRETIDTILAFEGRIVVVTEEPAAGLAPTSGELEYAGKLAEANRVLLRASHSVYRMTAGMAMEMKGYRLKGGNDRNENLYADR